MINIIRIKTLDTVFFRDSKPFTMGQEVWADSIFPPMPSVIYGAIRSTCLAHHIDIIEHNQIDTDKDVSSKLRIKGIFYGIESKLINQDFIYVPIPLDLVKLKNDKNQRAHLAEITKLKGIYYKERTEYVLTSQQNVESIENGIISISSLKRYLNGENQVSFTTLDKYLISEPKIGIARDNNKTAKDEMLYSINMIRLKDLVYIIDIEGINLPSTGFIKLGGQGKPSYYSISDYEIDFSDIQFNENDNMFKLYLLTPGLFSNGWLPSFIDQNTKILTKGNVKAQLLTAAIGKPKYVSGFDIKENKSRAMMKAVPEGSVYYFKLLEGSMEEVIKEFNYQSICDINDDYIKRGYGISIVGRV